jgi:ligand-binding sensor protein
MTIPSSDQAKKLDNLLLKATNWQKIQAAFSAMTGLSVLTYDTQGNLYYEPSQENPICKTVQLTAKGQQHCKDHCTKHALLAATSQEPLFFKCEANLHVFTLPVSVDDQFKLVLLGGKTYFDPQEFEDLRNHPDRVGTEDDRLAPLANEIRIKDPLFLQSAAQLLQRSAFAVLEGVYYRQKFRTKLSQLMTLFTIFAEMRKELSLPELYTLILHSIGVLFDVSTAAIFVREQDGKRFSGDTDFRTAQGTSPYLSGRDFGRVVGAASNFGTIYLHGSTYELLKSGFPRELRSAHFFSLSFTNSSGPQALLAIFDTALEEDDRQTLAAFSAHISQFVENQSLQEELKQQMDNLKLWMEVMKAIGSALDSDDLFQIILDKSTEFVEAEQGSLMLLDQEEQELSIKVTKGLHQRIVERNADQTGGRNFWKGSGEHDAIGGQRPGNGRADSAGEAAPLQDQIVHQPAA